MKIEGSWRNFEESCVNEWPISFLEFSTIFLIRIFFNGADVSPVDIPLFLYRVNKSPDPVWDPVNLFSPFLYKTTYIDAG